MKKPTLFIVFLTVFIAVVGFSIIFPLFPAILDYYLELEGENSLIGWLKIWLERFAGDDENAVATLFGGVLGSLYGILQFVFAPIWGAYSDRHGRRAHLSDASACMLACLCSAMACLRACAASFSFSWCGGSGSVLSAGPGSFDCR